LRVNLRKGVEFRVDLILRDRTLVSNEILEFIDFLLVLGLEAFDVLL